MSPHFHHHLPFAMQVRNLRLALNNQLVFMRTQRQDGRLPGMVTNAHGHPAGSGIVHPTYSYPGNANRSMLQGFYMASPAVDVAWLMNRSDDEDVNGNSVNGNSVNGNNPQASAFLAELKSTLERFDSWLWATRNSSHGDVIPILLHSHPTPQLTQVCSG